VSNITRMKGVPIGKREHMVDAAHELSATVTDA